MNPDVFGGFTLPPFAVEAVYMVSALLFVLALKRLGRVKSARTGNRLAMVAMLLAVLATFLILVGVQWWVLAGGLLVGTVLGVVLATRVAMTGMPELVAFFNGLGGAASALVALAEIARINALERAGGSVHVLEGVPFALALALSVLIGSVTLSGSLVAFGKLSGRIRGNRFGPIGAQAVNVLLALVVVTLAYWAGFGSEASSLALLATVCLALVALVLGVGLTVPIGGADMPVVISLLNSYSGLAACATGFVLENNLLIVAGSLVGASGLILTRIMCKAMNRSLVNVLFATFGEEATGGAGGDTEYKGVRSAGPEEAASIFEAARSVIIVPGYGMAVAQAQHKVRELASWLEQHGKTVRYAIHPVAGRMPGHMNVLLAEADVPYEQLFALEEINSDFGNADIALVLGANDVANPAANDDPTSPIAGMPVLNVWDAGTVFVVKRSLSSGYAGIKNPLFERDNTLMLFGDAKAILEDLLRELKDL
ncbi:MAG: NAD(P)(+) transhydrogenase (Re/Si-specific) subunit beta [Planctomycetota bacterium]